MRRVERFTLNFNLNVTLAVEILGFHVVQELTEPAQFALFVNRGTRFGVLALVVLGDAYPGLIHD